VAATDNLRFDSTVMRGFAQALCGGAEDLRSRLAELDAQVSEMLGGWRGASGSAYTSAWELWHRGAGEVEVGLSMLARLVAQAGGGYQENEAASARALREVRNG
jgi:WXG100 family type VII secretion target